MVSLFRPSYGRAVKVTPRRWWSPRDRKLARLAARLLDYEWERELESIMAAMRARALGAPPWDEERDVGFP